MMNLVLLLIYLHYNNGCKASVHKVVVGQRGVPRKEVYLVAVKSVLVVVDLLIVALS